MVECGRPAKATGIRCIAVGRVISPGQLTHAAGRAMCRLTIEADGSTYPVVFRDLMAEKAATLKLGELITLDGYIKPCSWKLDNGGEVSAVSIEPESLEAHHEPG
jgi:hypothetical protein